MKNLNSIRRYKIVTIDIDDVTIFDDIPIQDIIGKTNYSELELFDNPFFASELQYSLQDILDDILDLKLYDKLQFQSDRSVENSLGIIIRTQ
jgi:hypothetical protein